MSVQTIDFPNRSRATLMRVRQSGELPAAFAALRLASPCPVIVLIAGASGVRPEHEAAIRQVVETIARAAAQTGAAVIDGGTRAGGMQAMGAARAQAHATFPLIGVAAEGTVSLPDGQTAPEQCDLDPNHSHFLLVPGANWGDESPWIDAVAAALSAGHPSISVLVNGGAIGRQDVATSLAAARPVLVMQGTGRLADELAAAPPPTPLLRILPAHDPAALEQALLTALQA